MFGKASGGKTIWYSRVLMSLAFVACCSLVAYSQNSGNSFQKLLIDQARFSEENLASLAKGETVVRLLDVKDKRDVAVCGVVRLKDISELSLEVFRASMTQKNNRSVVGEGKFSVPPAITDLASLKLEKNDIRDLKECVVGDCKLQLSRAMIKRFQSDVDWNAADNSAKATGLFQQLLFEYLTDYSARGNAAFIKYENHREPLDLAEVHRDMLDQMLFVREIAPEFAKYLSDYPRNAPGGIENFLNWSKITFGLQPFLTMTHTVAYEHRDTDASQYLIATKQIYASRYIDASLALAMLVSVEENGRRENYLVFTDISQADSLGGAFGGLKRSVVGTEATARVTDVLTRAKYRLENPGKDPDPGDMNKGDGSNVEAALRFWESPYVYILPAIVVGALALFLYRKFRQKRS